MINFERRSNHTDMALSFFLFEVTSGSHLPTCLIKASLKTSQILNGKLTAFIYLLHLGLIRLFIPEVNYPKTWVFSQSQKGQYGKRTNLTEFCTFALKP